MNTSLPALSLDELTDERIAACVGACENIDTETLRCRGVASFQSSLERLTCYRDFTFRQLSKSRVNVSCCLQLVVDGFRIVDYW